MDSNGSRDDESSKESESLEEQKADQSKSTVKEKRYDPDDPTLTIVDEEDDLDFELEDFQSPRALMSCGHAVTPTSLTNWCRRQLDQGDRSFVCGIPGCDEEWSFQEVRRMALLTPEEIRDFEKKLLDNSKDHFNTKSCPGCKSTVTRTNFNNLCIKCTVCTKKRKAPFYFCWQCRRKWRGPSHRTDRCDNKGCHDKFLRTLKNCPDMTLKGVTGCPSIRACPTCGLLLGHDRTGCSKLSCPRCETYFCFVCLKKGCVWPCSGGVAPRQTSIPVAPKQPSYPFAYFHP